MNPDLPSNPWTITRPANMPRTAEGMRRAYTGRPRDESVKQQLEAEMNILRAWDNYERSTSATCAD